MLQAFAYLEEIPSSGFRMETLLVVNGDEKVVGNAVWKNHVGARSLKQSLIVGWED